MKRAMILATILTLFGGNAFAAESSGNMALALAAMVGAQSPDLSHNDKTVLVAFLSDNTAQLPASDATITVKADKIQCRMGDVDIMMHACTLTFGAKTVTVSGSAGQAFLATMQENGVQSDGAAGTIYYNVAPLSCTVNVSEVKSRDGGGAKCTFTNAG